MPAPNRLIPIALALLAAAGALAPRPARAVLQQPSEERERERDRIERERERARERAERDRERARERAERDRERARERAERERDEGQDASQGPTRIDTTVSVGRDASVDLSLISGNVTVTAWGRGDVQVRGYSERLPLRFEHQGGRVRVWVPSTNRRGNTRSGDQRLEVVVPVGTRVAAQTVSGNVRVSGVRGELEAGTVSGDVDASDGVRRVALNSVSGAVRGTNVEGDVRAHSVSGEVILDQVNGEIDAQSVSGEVEIRRARSSRLRMESVSGELTYEGAIARDGRYEFNSHSGEIHLLIPPDVGAELSLRTFSGSIDTAFPLTMRSDTREDGRRNYGPRERRMDFTLGGGGARIIAETFSGSITIGRAGTRR